MAGIHTAMPEGEGHGGERRFADRLSTLCGELFDLWFGLDYLPGVADLDLLVCNRNHGFFVVEVKAIDLSAIVDCSATHLTIKNRHTDRHPLKQARRAQIGLIEYLKSVRIYPPFFFTTAALPDIQGSDFLERFGGVPAIAMQAEGMLFKEDLVSEQALEDRLAYIVERPPYGAPPQHKRPPGDAVIQQVLEALEFEGKPKASAGDIERSRSLKEKLPRKSILANYVQPGSRPPVVFRGYPGTGKTYLLLRIALEHARAGRSVLFACFNKVLASDIRRMLATTDFPKDVISRIDVTHVWALRARYATAYVPGDDAVLSELSKIRSDQSPLEEYGTICLDEAQDLPEWAFHLIQWHATEKAEWFFAHGPGQEMYSDDPAPYLTEILEAATAAKRIEQLKRVYRTAQIDFLVAQGVFEHAPDLDAIPNWVSERPLPVQPDHEDSDQETLFGEPLDVSFEAAGRLPTILEIPQWDPELAPDDKSLRRQYLKDVLSKELSHAAAEERPGDVAVLLRNVSDRRDADDVRSILAELSVPYTDQIEPANRDLMLPAGHVRLVSFKSARGIEAHRTILVGFDDLVGESGHTYRDSRNQAYVALSRSRASTTVVSRPHRRHEFSSFLVALVNEYAKQADMTVADGLTPQTPQHQLTAWAAGIVDRIVEDRGFGFIRSESGEEVFFHVSSLLGIKLSEAAGKQVSFTPVVADQGLRATIVALAPPVGHHLVPQPGCVPGYVATPAGERGFGFLLTPDLAKTVFFHVNQVASSRPLATGERVDLMLDDSDPEKPRAMLVASRS